MFHPKGCFLPGLAACALCLAPGCDAPHEGRSPAGAFPLELDHVLVWVAPGAPEAKALEDAGLQLISETSKHVGQGTASKAFLFENAYLELIWVDDEQAVSANAARTGVDMGIRAGWKRSGASPFGIGLHRTAGATRAIPFPVMDYWAEWMEPRTSIQFARTVGNHEEPMYFVMPDSMAIPDAATLESLKKSDPAYAKMLIHRLGISKLTGVRVVAACRRVTSTGETLSEGGVSIERGEAPLMELTFDGGVKRERIDLQPQLPLILRY